MTPDELWGSGDLSRLFAAGELGVTPWPRARRRKSDPPFDQALVAARVAGVVTWGDDLQAVDPRTLVCSQPGLVRSGVAHYLTDAWRLLGRTYADQSVRANQYPLVYARGDERIILAGHHRSAAALLAGTPVLARVVIAGAVAPTPSAVVVVTAALALGSDPMPASDLPRPTVLAAGAWAEAHRTLVSWGADDAWATNRLRLAGHR